jgi:hypothetical protein
MKISIVNAVAVREMLSELPVIFEGITAVPLNIVQRFEYDEG